MSVRFVRWNWRYTLQFASGRAVPARPKKKHAVPEGSNTALCNRIPYWRLPEDIRRWLGEDPAEAAVLAELEECQACQNKIALMEKDEPKETTE